MTSAPSPGVALRIFDEEGEAGREAALALVRAARAAAAGGRPFAVALTGGSSPATTFRSLASPPLREQVPWDSVHLFWGDERCVPPGHPRSNFGMANRLLISAVPIPAANVHRIRGELHPREAADRYADELASFFGASTPRFDLIHLGMGDDGHVCSLFPFDPLLLENECTTGVALLRTLGEWRVTLTYPAINSVAEIHFLVYGEAKSERVREVVLGPRDPLRIPAQGVHPANGDITWWVDRRAAARLHL